MLFLFLLFLGVVFFSLMCNSKQQLLLVSCVTSLLTKIHYHDVPAGMTAVRFGLVAVWLVIMTEERPLSAQSQIHKNTAAGHNFQQSFENLNSKSHGCQKTFSGLWDFLYLQPDKREFVIIQSKYSKRKKRKGRALQAN